MKKIIFALSLSLFTQSCSWISFFSEDTAESSLFSIVNTSAQLYRERNLEEYFKLFDQNINVFNTNGLGTARVVSGHNDFKSFTRTVHKAKVVDLEILSHFTHNNWVFVKQRSKVNLTVVEAAVGYRIQNGKIADIMIIGEKNMDDK